MEGEKIQVLREGFALTPEHEKIRQDFQEADNDLRIKIKNMKLLKIIGKRTQKQSLMKCRIMLQEVSTEVAQYFQLSRKKGEWTQR